MAATSLPDLGSAPGDVLRNALERATRHLVGIQRPEGYWWTELESNSTLTSEYVFLTHMLDRVDPARERKCIKELLGQQLPDGGWGIGDHRAGELSTSVEAYTALRMSGCDADSEPLRRARAFILERGGLDRVRTFTKIHLALLGLYEYEALPVIPPWILLFPDRSPLSIYQMSSWARSCVVPLVVLLARKPVWRPQRALSVDELRLQGPSSDAEPGGPWSAFFLHADRALHALERRGLVPFRWTALQRAERWILAHQDDEGDWGGIFPAMEYSLLALRALGYPDAHPALRRGWQAIERFGLETADSYRMQACVSPVWDTALATWALAEAGASPDHRALARSAEWLLGKQIDHYGDWSVKNRSATPGGWSFEFFNRFYPDVDDSAACILALCGLRLGANDAWRDASVAQACRWISSMQSRDGGWAAFDVDNTQELWNEIPFADHKAMLDPSTPDVTGRVLEMLGTTGLGDADRVARAIRFLTDRQRADGSWYGRWGVNFVYGTWAVLCGLRAVSIAASDPRIARGADFLLRAQNADGGWGESTESYDEDRFVAGPSTASQTAWGVMGLQAAGLGASEQVDRGLQWLVAAQRPGGGWDETAFTGTGFPGHFYIRYHLYRDCFPTMALGRAVRLRAGR